MNNILLSHAEEFIQKSMTTIPFPVSALFSSVADPFLKLLEEPDEYKKDWLFDVAGNGDPDDGLIYRIGDKNQYGFVNDEKEFFHFRPRLWELLEERGVDIGPYKHWLQDCEKLRSLCVAKQLEFAKALDLKLPSYNFADMVSEEKTFGLHTLRLVRYKNSQAKFHQDRSLLTFPINYTEGRSSLLTGEEHTPYIPQLNHTLVFSGKKMGYLTGGELDENENIFQGGKIPALLHGVSKDKDTDHGGEKRVAIIFFGHAEMFLPGKN